MTPIAATAPAPKAPLAAPKATDHDDRFAALVDDDGAVAPAPSDPPAQDAAKPAPAVKPTPAPAAQATAATTLAALIAAANGEAAPAPAAEAPAAPEAKLEREAPADPKAEAKPVDMDAPAPAPAATLPIAAPVLAAMPTPLTPAPPVATPTAKVAPKDEKLATTTASDAKASHTAPVATDAPAPAPAKADATPTGDFKAALDGALPTPQTHVATTAPTLPDTPVSARPGQIGAETGIQIARQINAGQNEFLLRLNPAEHGHIQIHMRFAEDGALRAVISADSATVLDMLRKDSADLTRALGHAGVRTDAQSFSFGSQGQDGQRNPRGTPHGSAQGWNQTATDQTEDTPLPRFRPLHGGLGILDRLA